MQDQVLDWITDLNDENTQLKETLEEKLKLIEFLHRKCTDLEGRVEHYKTLSISLEEYVTKLEDVQSIKRKLTPLPKVNDVFEPQYMEGINYKGMLNEILMKQQKPLPHIFTNRVSGTPDHAPLFTAFMFLDDKEYTVAPRPTKKDAENFACFSVLQNYK
jgi:hypothetical protein